MVGFSSKLLLLAPVMVIAVAVLLISQWLNNPAPNEGSGAETIGGVEMNPESATVTAVVAVAPSMELPATFAAKYERLAREFEAAISEAELMQEVTLRLAAQGESPPTSVARALAVNPESYTINVTPASVEITGADELGLLHGMTDVQNRLASGVPLKPGRSTHSPYLATRGAHIVLRGLDVQSVRDMIERTRRARMNTLVIQLADGVRLESIPRIARPDALNKDQLKELIAFARENGQTVVPELKLLTHQGKFLKKAYPELMFDAETYDPRREDVYELVFRVIDEVLELFAPVALHIGHDEVFGHGGGSGRPETILPPDLFLKDVLRLHEYLTKRNVTVWMWGDMLINPREFPGMKAQHLHANKAYAALRNQIPNDIVICDWHYSDRGSEFPSAAAFAELGHRVIGATWKRPITIQNFSRFISELPRGGEGMLATTWFHVQRNDREILDRIFYESGSSFWGPD